MAIINIKDVFGITPESDLVSIQTPEKASDVPPVNSGYVFQKESLEDLLMYMADPAGDGMMLTGPAGCGKTSAVINLCGYLNWGLTQVTVGSRTEAADLIGRPAIRDGQIIFEYGALVKAMRAGHVLLINEIDMMAPGELASLNDVLEGRPLTVTQHEGEVIEPSPFFRVFATANSKGAGDGYAGARMMNAAFMDRWRHVELDYPAAKAEQLVLKLAAPGLDSSALHNFRALAERLRESYNNQDLSAPFSTRSLVRAALLRQHGLSVDKALDVAFGSKLPAAEREFVKRSVFDIFGHGDDAATPNQSGGETPQPEQETAPEEEPKRRRRRRTLTGDLV